MPDSRKTAFERDGYVLVRGVYSPDEIRKLESEFDRIVEQIQACGENTNARWEGDAMDKLGANDLVVHHTHNVQQYSAAWLAALLHPSFLEASRDLLGPDVILHHTKLFHKPPENGAPFPMHQDWSYFPTKKDTMLAAVVHVSRADDSMGCLRVYPGSHRLGRKDESSGWTDENWLRDYPIEGATPVEAEAGDVLFFHYLTVHGSLPNRSQKSRKTVLVQLHAGDDEMEPGVTHPYEGLALSGWNHCMSRERANRS
jgi:ectoine hydroxylase-related dioxygenase (phytanoyl-CoA dioxygenase family)